MKEKSFPFLKMKIKALLSDAVLSSHKIIVFLNRKLLLVLFKSKGIKTFLNTDLLN